MGELRLAGITDAASQARLAAEAALIAQLVHQDRELEDLTSELIETQDKLLAFYDLARATRSHLGMAETLKSLAQEAARLVKSEYAFLALKAPSGNLTIEDYGSLPTGDETNWLLTSFEQALIDGRELSLAANTEANGEGTRSHGLPPGVRNLFLVPIPICDERRAALALVNKAVGPFASPDVKLARAIAEQAGRQIENILLYQETLVQTRLETEMELARTVQMRLLPQHVPTVNGLDLWSGTRPALRVGGDFYDFVSRAQGPLTFAVGDVSGKGMPAALLMSMTHAVFQSAASATPLPTPEEMLGHVNEQLYDDFTEVGAFVTAFVGQYDSANRRLTYANAGHSPVICCPRGGRAALLEADGPALGVLPASLCRDQILRFMPGDLLVVATDGFSEAQNAAGEMFGYEQLLRLVERLTDEPAREIGATLYATVEQFAAGHPQDDDQTLVVLKGLAT